MLDAPQLLSEIKKLQAKVAELFNAADPAQEGQLSRADVSKLITAGLGLRASKREVEAVL